MGLSISLKRWLSGGFLVPIHSNPARKEKEAWQDRSPGAIMSTADIVTDFVVEKCLAWLTRCGGKFVKERHGRNNQAI